jgi:hypothetical protein
MTTTKENKLERERETKTKLKYEARYTKNKLRSDTLK